MEEYYYRQICCAGSVPLCLCKSKKSDLPMDQAKKRHREEKDNVTDLSNLALTVM